MAQFVNVGQRTLNLDQITEIRWMDQDVRGRPQVKVYFPGGGDDERDFTTLSPEEGAVLADRIRDAQSGAYER